MSVNFAAVHDQNPWRKHRMHQSLTAAIDGKDGARNLLLRRGRVAGMWRKYGAVRCVFVWDNQADFFEAFNKIERSRAAREACIAHYKCVCVACGMDFGKTYGDLGQGFIHVHHRVPIASIGQAYQVDPIKDLIPVYPNCHAVFPPMQSAAGGRATACINSW